MGEHKTVDGNSYYHKAGRKATQWDRPRLGMNAEVGKTYICNRTSGRLLTEESLWEVTEPWQGNGAKDYPEGQQIVVLKQIANSAGKNMWEYGRTRKLQRQSPEWDTIEECPIPHDLLSELNKLKAKELTGEIRRR